MGLHPRLAELTADLHRRLEVELPALGPETRTGDMFQAGIAGNLETLLHALRYGIDIHQIGAPTAAMEHARRLAQKGVPVHTLVRAYRIGQRRMNELVFAEVLAADMEPLVRISVLERISATLFDYIDWISQQVVETYEVERERWLENQNSLRALRVREILAGRAPVDIDAATSTIRYPLSWHHLSLVIWRPWSSADDNVLLALQRFLREVAEDAEAGAGPLFVAADQTTGWGWLPFRAAAPDAIERIRRFAATRADSPSVAIGTMAAGLDGFRTSHRLAAAAHAVAVARGPISGPCSRQPTRVWPRPRCWAVISPRPGTGWSRSWATWPPTPTPMTDSARRCTRTSRPAAAASWPGADSTCIPTRSSIGSIVRSPAVAARSAPTGSMWNWHCCSATGTARRSSARPSSAPRQRTHRSWSRRDDDRSRLRA